MTIFTPSFGGSPFAGVPFAGALFAQTPIPVPTGPPPGLSGMVLAGPDLEDIGIVIPGFPTI